MQGPAVSTVNPAPPSVPTSLTLEEQVQPVENETNTVDIAVPDGMEAAEPQMDAMSANNGEDVIVVMGRKKSAADPVEAINVKSYEATAALDGAVFEPVAMAYQKTLPDPVRSGVRNFLGNLREPVVFVNFLLQHKIGKAAETVGRFAINSTVGAAGLVDVAKSKSINLPRRPNGFADTLGFYGVKSGAYLYLPLIGPTTVRDLVGEVADRMVMPMVIGSPFNTTAYSVPTNTVGILDRRSEQDEQIRELRECNNDPYRASREFYLQRRQNEIDLLHGKVPGPLPAQSASADKPAQCKLAK